VKRIDKTIESVLAPGASHDFYYKSALDVAGCILSLEDQTKHIPKERKEAEKKRDDYVHGKRESWK